MATDGTVTDGPYPRTKELSGGFTVVDVPTRDAALEWAAKIAVACRWRKRFGSSGPTPNSTQCSARWLGDGNVRTTSDRRRPAGPEQELPWPWSDLACTTSRSTSGRRCAMASPN